MAAAMGRRSIVSLPGNRGIEVLIDVNGLPFHRKTDRAHIIFLGCEPRLLGVTHNP
jgi:hypothetical protein